MEIKGNTYYFTYKEKSKIKKLIDERYGKITTVIDYETTYGDYDVGVEGEIYSKTGKRISGSTIERLVGLTGDENTGVRNKTLEIICKYLEFNDINQLIAQVEYTLKHPVPKIEKLVYKEVFINHIVKIEFGSNKIINVRYLNNNIFEIVDSINSKLIKGDKINISILEVGEALICKELIRIEKNKTRNLGKYSSGENNHVTSISFSKS